MADPPSNGEPRAGSPTSTGPPDPLTMWEEFAAPLRAFLARRVPAGVEPDDVLQEVFVRVVRHLPSLRNGDRMEPGSTKLHEMRCGMP